MPLFLERHPDVNFPLETFQALLVDARTGAVDGHGARQVDWFFGARHPAYCVIEAPDAEAVRLHHAARGLACGPVWRLEGLRDGRSALSAKDAARVRRAIAEDLGDTPR